MKRKRKAGYVRPVPEVPAREAYSVSDQGGFTPDGEYFVDLDDRVFSVPTDETETAWVVRMHESMHLRFTPKDSVTTETLAAHGVRKTDIAVAEDARVNCLTSVAFGRSSIESGKLAKMTRLDAQHEMTIARKAIANDNVESAVRLAVARTGIQHSKRMRKEAYDAFVEACRDDITGAINPLLRQACNTLAKAYQRCDRMEKEAKRFGRSASCYGVGILGGMDVAWELARMLAEVFPPPLSKEGQQRGRTNGQGKTPDIEPGSGAAQWDAVQEVEELPRPVRVAPRGRRYTTTDIGAVPSRMERHAVDQKVFRRKRSVRRPGCVLLDVSGSMSVCNEHIVDIIRAAPLATVAVYNSNGIRVVARDGFMVDGEVGTGSGNGIDLPALEWMVREEGPPYVWVTDGLVGSDTYGYTEQHSRDCLVFAERNYVQIIDEAQDAGATMRALLALK